jgi:hypothetical protein
VRKLSIDGLREIARSRGGQLLSDTYVNCDTPLVWQCATGHKWKANATNVKNCGKWCKRCADARSGLKKRLPLQDLHELAVAREGTLITQTYVNAHGELEWECKREHRWKASASYVKHHSLWCPECPPIDRLEGLQALAKRRGGKLLSAVYLHTDAHLSWQCAKNHQWNVSSTNVKRGTWCPECAGVARIDVDDLRVIALTRNGRLLSQQCAGAFDHLLWECARGHRWRATATSVKAKTWCPTCARIGRRASITELQEIARANQGLLLSKHYITADKPLLWQCKREHRWKASAGSVRNGKTWCRYCGFERMGTTQRIDFRELENLADIRGGRVISVEYQRGKNRVLWNCSNSHRWKTNASNIRKGTWCPICASGRGERMVRCCFEFIFKQAFPRSRTSWLGRQHLDGFCEQLAIAFEYDGEQHFRIIRRFKMTRDVLQASVNRDRRKDASCASRGVTLLRIREVNPLTPEAMLTAVLNVIRASNSAMILIDRLGLTLPDTVDEALRARMFAIQQQTI